MSYKGYTELQKEVKKHELLLQSIENEMNTSQTTKEYCKLQKRYNEEHIKLESILTRLKFKKNKNLVCTTTSIL